MVLDAVDMKRRNDAISTQREKKLCEYELDGAAVPRTVCGSIKRIGSLREGEPEAPPRSTGIGPRGLTRYRRFE